MSYSFSFTFKKFMMWLRLDKWGGEVKYLQVNSGKIFSTSLLFQVSKVYAPKTPKTQVLELQNLTFRFWKTWKISSLTFSLTLLLCETRKLENLISYLNDSTRCKFLLNYVILCNLKINLNLSEINLYSLVLYMWPFIPVK